MWTYLKTAPTAARIEFAAAGLWIAAGLAAGVYTGVLLTLHPWSYVTPEGGVVTNPPPILASLTFIVLGLVGALPSAGVGAILHSRDRFNPRFGAVLAIVLGALYVAGVAWITIDNLNWAASHPGATVDFDFLAIGAVVVVAGLMHAVSGVVELRGWQGASPTSGPRPAGA